MLGLSQLNLVECLPPIIPGSWEKELVIYVSQVVCFLICVETLGVLPDPDGLMFLLHQPHTVPVHHMGFLTGNVHLSYRTVLTRMREVLPVSHQLHPPSGFPVTSNSVSYAL